MKLNENQKRFADYYIETGNGVDAYRKAGYKAKSDATMRTNASKLLTNPNVRAYIDDKIAQKDDERVAKQDEILQFLTKVMRGEHTEQIPVGKGEGYFELEDKDTYVKDRVKAAELLGKRYAMWTDRQQVDAVMGVQIVDDVPGSDEE
ncbi:terminase small subunit [Paenibacillus polymyxa]|uniref:terminase small subunit n=1 Tax=Paenibacillus polymyxa TaxID=1406 RepID=UPI0025B64127|nr:terminase small subunit [Paenibacillus polymyxa]MDN4085955.1 terminase small subunit [Paenibacillus polymyxa]MDN4111857.1 terminase small subunit [Paenibacillus polymyxa]MEE4561566.1 terminase small subunit [Paenibacillus polymyxa]